MSLLLDTNILVYLIRNSNLKLLDKNINPNKERIYLSIASIGEIKTMALINNWGKGKLQIMKTLFDNIPILEITENFVDTYAQIDAFSQCRNPAYRNYPFKTPRNMGKNDLWIAATAALFGFKLLTTDTDFTHLNDVFLEVQMVKAEFLK